MARACRAALAIRAALATDPGSPAIRIGIQSGPTLVGNIGAPGRLNYTLVGDTVNVAQRLEQLGKSVSPGERTTILIAAATFDHLRGSQVRTEKVGEMQMTGTDKLILVHRL